MNISRSQAPIREVGQLPAKWKINSPFYEVKFGNDLYIDPKYSNNIFSVVSVEASGKSKAYLFAFYDDDNNKNDILGRAREILNNYKTSKDAHLDLEFSIIENERVRSVLSEEINKQKTRLGKNKKVRTEKNKNEEDKKAEETLKYAEDLLYKAMKLKASDLHIESDGQVAIIRLRIHKELGDYGTLSHVDAVELSALFYGQFVRGVEEDQEKGSGSGVYIHGNILDGEFSRVIKDVSMKARMVNIGQNNQNRYTMVLRLIDKNKAAKPIPYSVLRFSQEACNMLKVLQRASRGMILVCGVTGSGKSTSIQNMMMHERDRCGNTRKMYSIEQPIEQQMPRITQINGANSHEGEEVKTSEQDFSFENLNRALMRGDPDSITYGEIRDKNTASSAVKGVESGHLVYGTMHVTETMGAFSRFQSFGVELEKVCRKSFIQMIMYQHLIPELCPHCSKSYKKGGEVPKEFGEWYAVKSFRHPDGRSLDIGNILSLIEKEEENGEEDISILRLLQRERLIKSYDVSSMQHQIDSMNSDNSNTEFQTRLDNLISSSTMQEKDINIKFRGDGCKHCHQGTIGVIPAAEILIPDETFLDLILSKRTNQAEAYWKSKLGGRSATRDMYSKILTGKVDPRMVETELSNIGS